MSTEDLAHLFVYGTLRRAVGHPMHARLFAGSRPVGLARTRGALYMANGYPGLVLDPREGWVVGEVYHLHDLALLAELDAYEGAGADDPEPREYQRVIASVELVGAAPLASWVYAYTWPTAGLERITSGDFVQAIHARLDAP